MKLALAFLNVLLFVNCVIAKECEERDPESCLNDMVKTLKDGQPEVACRAVTNAKECMENYVDKCLGPAGKAALQESLDQMTKNVALTCSARDDDTTKDDEEVDDDDDNDEVTDKDKGVLKCLNDQARIMTFVGECTEKVFEDIKNRRFMFGISSGDVACNAYLSIARCVAKKVGGVCGEALEEPFYNGILLPMPQSNAMAARSPRCSIAIRQAEEYFKKSSRKRRSLPVVPYIRLMP